MTIKCKLCEKIFKSEDDKTKHLNSKVCFDKPVKINKNLYKCFFCREDYTSKDECLFHMNECGNGGLIYVPIHEYYKNIIKNINYNHKEETKELHEKIDNLTKKSNIQKV